MKFFLISESQLFHILEYRNDESIHKTSQALTGNVAVLGRIANDTKRENERMARISEQSSKDSRAMRVLTFVATLYLPATFMAVSSEICVIFLADMLSQTLFSSNLISLESPGSQTEKKHLVLTKATWVCALATILLMIITVIATFWFERKWTTNRRF